MGIWQAVFEYELLFRATRFLRQCEYGSRRLRAATHEESALVLGCLEFNKWTIIMVALDEFLSFWVEKKDAGGVKVTLNSSHDKNLTVWLEWDNYWVTAKAERRSLTWVDYLPSLGGQEARIIESLDWIVRLSKLATTEDVNRSHHLLANISSFSLRVESAACVGIASLI